MLLSWGASRNGPEVMERIARFDEWERVSHAGLPLGAGGAHFVTLQAAIELQILRDLEQRTRPVTEAYIRSGEFLDDIRAYRPSAALEDVVMDTHSTANGGNYGRSSPAIQMRAYGRAIAARRALGLWHEVEWVQFLRSWAMTRFAIAHDDLALAAGGQLNVTILFGFSPKLPFPTSYQEFRTVVQAAKSLEFDADGRRRRGVTIAVGAAVLPQHARKHVGRLTEGRRVIDDACALRRLVAYAARPDSDVDILRAGMEDTPYVVDDVGRIRPTTNGELARRVAAWIDSEGANIVLDPRRLGHAVAPRHGWNEQSLERIAA
jgi:hypothetical protein